MMLLDPLDGWKPDLLNLRDVCRPGPLCTVTLHTRYKSHPWLSFTEPCLDAITGRSRWIIGARMGYDATDPEEDSAYAIRFELVGVRLDSITNGVVTLEAWISADDPSSFNVPKLGWNPLATAVACRSRSCEPRGHPIVDRFVPEANLELYQLVRGLRVMINLRQAEVE